MIEFEWWYNNVVSIARMIAHDDELHRAWIMKDSSVISAYDYDELAEQVLGDLRVEENALVFGSQLEAKGALVPLTNFINEFVKLHAMVSHGQNPHSEQELLASPQWESLRKAAQLISQIS